jgi:hypothetical protein
MDRKIRSKLRLAKFVLYMCAKNIYTESDLIRCDPDDATATELRKACFSKRTEEMQIRLVQEILHFQEQFFENFLPDLPKCDFSRFEYACFITKASKNTPTPNWTNFFKLNCIDPVEFSTFIWKWLNSATGKVNTLRFIGPPDTGKTMLSRAISQVFLAGYITKSSLAGNSDFCFSPIVNKSIAIFEEPIFQIPIAQDVKSIFAGDQISVNVKFKDAMTIKTTPCLVTSNSAEFGRGFLSGLDELALRARCKSYSINSVCKPQNHMTSGELYSFILQNIKID